MDCRKIRQKRGERKMKIENGEKLLFIGDSVTDDNRARPVGEGNNAALGNGFVRLIDGIRKKKQKKILAIS